MALARALAERGWRLVLDARGATDLEAVADELSARTDVVAVLGDELTRATAEAKVVNFASNLAAVMLFGSPSTCGLPSAALSPVTVLRTPWLRSSRAALTCELRYCYPPVRVCRVSLDRVNKTKINRARSQCLLW